MPARSHQTTLKSPRLQPRYPHSNSHSLSHNPSTSLLRLPHLTAIQTTILICSGVTVAIVLVKIYRIMEKQQKEKASERARRELLRLNVKHGVVDADGSLKSAGGGSGAGGSRGNIASGSGAGRGKGADEGKKRERERSNTPSPARFTIPSLNTIAATTSSLLPAGTTSLLGLKDDTSAATPSESASASTNGREGAVSLAADETGPAAASGSGAGAENASPVTPAANTKAMKLEMKKAKKKQQRQAKLESRRSSQLVETVKGDGGGEEEDTTPNGGAKKQVEASRIEEEEKVEEEEAEEEETPIPGGRDVEDAHAKFDSQDNGIEWRSVNYARKTPSFAQDTPASSSSALETASITSSISRIPPSISICPTTLLFDDIVNIPLPESPRSSSNGRPTLESRRRSEVFSDSGSLLSVESSYLNGVTPLSAGLQSVSSGQANKKKRKPKSSSAAAASKGMNGTTRIVPGAENWVKDTAVEKARLEKEELAKVLEEARAATTSAETRAQKVEKERDHLQDRLKRLESTVSRLSAEQKDLKEREKTVSVEREDAVRRITEVQANLLRHKSTENGLKNELNQMKREKERFVNDFHRKEIDLRNQLQQAQNEASAAMQHAAAMDASMRNMQRMQQPSPTGIPFPSPSPHLHTPTGLLPHPMFMMNSPVPRGQQHGNNRMTLSQPPSPQPQQAPSMPGSPWMAYHGGGASPADIASPARKRTPSDFGGAPPALTHMNSSFMAGSDNGQISVDPPPGLGPSTPASSSTPNGTNPLVWAVMKNKGGSPAPSVVVSDQNQNLGSSNDSSGRARHPTSNGVMKTGSNGNITPGEGDPFTHPSSQFPESVSMPNGFGGINYSSTGSRAGSSERHADPGTGTSDRAERASNAGSSRPKASPEPRFGSIADDEPSAVERARNTNDEGQDDEAGSDSDMAPVFPSLFHNPKDVEAAMQEARRASMIRRTSSAAGGLTLNTSVTPIKTLHTLDSAKTDDNGGSANDEVDAVPPGLVFGSMSGSGSINGGMPGSRSSSTMVPSPPTSDGGDDVAIYPAEPPEAALYEDKSGHSEQSTPSPGDMSSDQTA